MTDVLVCLEISVEHKTFTHGVSSELGDVDGSWNSSSELKLVGLHRDNLNKRYLSNKLFWILVV